MSRYSVTDGYHARVYEAPSKFDAQMAFIEEFDLPSREHDCVFVTYLGACEEES